MHLVLHPIHKRLNTRTATHTCSLQHPHVPSHPCRLLNDIQRDKQLLTSFSSELRRLEGAWRLQPARSHLLRLLTGGEEAGEKVGWDSVGCSYVLCISKGMVQPVPGKSRQVQGVQMGSTFGGLGFIECLQACTICRRALYGVLAGVHLAQDVIVLRLAGCVGVGGAAHDRHCG